MELVLTTDTLLYVPCGVARRGRQEWVSVKGGGGWRCGGVSDNSNSEAYITGIIPHRLDSQANKFGHLCANLKPKHQCGGEQGGQSH